MRVLSILNPCFVATTTPSEHYFYFASLSKFFSEIINFDCYTDLLSYHKTLTSDSVETKVVLAELCLAECMFKVVLHSHIMDLLSVIAYSLQIPKLTPQVCT